MRRSSFLASFMDSLCRVRNKIIYVLLWRKVLMRSLECYFGVYFPRCCATREINTKITLLWAHKQFATRVHTLYIFMYMISVIWCQIVVIPIANALELPQSCTELSASNLRFSLTHCGLVKPCGDIDLGQHWLLINANGLMPDGTKPSPEPMLTYHYRCSIAFTWEQICKTCPWT